MSRIKNISALIVMSFVLSLVWCDDAICSAAADSHQCEAGLNGSGGDRHDLPSGSAESHSCTCICACHIPSVVNDSAELTVVPPIRELIVLEASRLISVPGKTLLRPPLAA
jgi:hypothetical protein